MRKNVLLLITGLVCAINLIASSGNETAWIERGKDAVKTRLKDPSSAQFRNVYFHRGADNIPVSCGEVNSKNGFGGYVGFQRFVSAGKPELTFLEKEVSGFNTTWKQFCK